MKKIRLNSMRLTLCILMLVITASTWAAPQLPPLNDPPSGISLPGKFTWFDMAVPALDTQKEFYASVFGWSYRSPAKTDDGYTLIMNRGRAIGGMFQYEPPGGEQDGAAWIVLMSVSNPGESERIVKSEGGSVDIAPTAIPGRGRHALFRDPAGALFGVLKSDSGDPPDTEVEIGAFLWLDLFARDPEAMTAFYRQLAPYETEEREIAADLSRTLLIAHDMPRASIIPVDEEANRAAWVPYVRVEDVEETLQKVVDFGGFAIIPPDERLLDGNVAVFVDPHGGVTGIVKWDYDQEAGQ